LAQPIFLANDKTGNSPRRALSPPCGAGFFRTARSLSGARNNGKIGPMSVLAHHELLACDRVSDRPEPRVPSVMERCVDCGARVWVPFDTPPVTLICIQCAEAEADDAA